jgi:hypothetical protein
MNKYTYTAPTNPAILDIKSFNQDDLVTPSATALYPVGAILETTNGANVFTYMYVKSHAALIQFQPYTVVPSSTTGTAWITAAPITLPSGVTVCVPQVAFTSGYYGFVQIGGFCTAILADETHVSGDYLELLTTGPEFVVDGTSGSTTYSQNSVAIQISDLSGGGTAGVNLFSGLRTALVSAS